MRKFKTVGGRSPSCPQFFRTLSVGVVAHGYDEVLGGAVAWIHPTVLMVGGDIGDRTWTEPGGFAVDGYV